VRKSKLINRPLIVLTLIPLIIILYVYIEIKVKGREERLGEVTISTDKVDILQEIQPMLDRLNISSFIKNLEDEALMYKTSDTDMLILQMTSRFYEKLETYYTLEELREIPEVGVLESYLWEQLGVSKQDLESVASRLPELLEEQELEEVRVGERTERNRRLLLDNVVEVRTNFKGIPHEGLFDDLITYADLDQEEAKELVYLILEVSFYIRSKEPELQQAVFRERVLTTVVEGLWNSSSPMAFMGLNSEYQPLLTLLVELTISQIENIE
jgi:hypothetical protein